MSTEIAVPNLADTIRDRVREQIVSAIPDEQINNFIKKEWAAYFERPTLNNWSNHKEEDKLSPFQREVRKHINEHICTKIKEAVDKEMKMFNESAWNAEGKKFIEQFVREYAPMAMHGISEMIVRNTMNQLTQGNPNFQVRY
jgi:hypothetical protein